MGSMEQISQLRGGTNKINTIDQVTDHGSHDVPVIHDSQATESITPQTFAEAERRNPYALLRDLHEHALNLNAGRRPDAAYHLTELALSAAVVSWWSRWQPISMHRAFLGGASLSEVAAAVGTAEDEVYERWLDWAKEQSDSMITGRPGVDAKEVAEVRMMLGVR